ncbi:MULTISPECIES: glycosyltransferase family 2 protein [Cupriavidus]
MKLSIVATLYQSASYVEEFCARADAAARRFAEDDYEIVLVNDGSPDDSLDIAVRISEENSHVVVVDLSRNFGHYKAMMTGLAHAGGDYIFLIDSDIEEDPDWLSSFGEKLEREQCDVVFGVQERRKGKFFERWSGQWFYRIFRLITGLPLPDNIVTARLMSRRYVEALLRHDEREVFIAGLWLITGFDQRPQIVRKHSSSDTTYTFGRKMSVLINSITAFSNAPLVAIFYVGVAISVVAGLYAASLVVNWLFFFKPLSGWTSVMASIWLLGGLIISFIGIIGVYLSKIFSETKRRPYTIVRKVYGRKGA